MHLYLFLSVTYSIFIFRQIDQTKDCNISDRNFLISTYDIKVGINNKFIHSFLLISQIETIYSFFCILYFTYIIGSLACIWYMILTCLIHSNKRSYVHRLFNIAARGQHLSPIQA